MKGHFERIGMYSSPWLLTALGSILINSNCAVGMLKDIVVKKASSLALVRVMLMLKLVT